MSEINSQRIFKNTLYLYFRMLLLMVISLYTSRVIFITLGVIDYGIYDLVGGVIILFSFFDVALSNATMRFLSYELGNKNFDKLRKTFCMSVNVHLFLALIVIIIGETIGLWFFNTQLNIPSERMIAARWVYHLSVATFIMNIIKVPFNSLIISYEKMSFYAILSLFEGLLKLGIVFLLRIFSFDKLVLYGILTFSISVIVLVVYIIYSSIKFSECRFTLMWDKSLFGSLINFSGWSMFESIAQTSSSQGAVVLLNIFFDVTLNAVMGIATRVGSVVNEFVWNFQKAFKPQIVKSYSTSEKDDFYILVSRTSKLSYYLLFVISLPILIYTQEVLELWLKEVPFYSATFTRMVLIVALIEAISGPLWMVVHATGTIRRYQVAISLLIFSNLWISWLLLALGLAPPTVLFVRIFVSILCFIYRVYYLKKYVSFDISSFLKDVLLKIFYLTSITLITLYIVLKFISSINIFLIFIIIVLLAALFTYLLGLTKKEKDFIFEMAKNLLGKIKNKETYSLLDNYYSIE